MECNVGKTDKTIRLIAGALIFLLGLVFKNWWGLLGVVLVLTAIFGRCGLYVPFGINTTKPAKKE